MNKTKVFSTGMLCLALILSAQSSSGMNLSVNSSSQFGLSENVFYDVSGKTIELKVSEPIICHVVDPSTVSFLKAQIIDSNGDSKIMPVLSNFNYDVISQVISLEVNSADAVCVTESGSNFGDLIYRNQFEKSELRFEGLGNQIVRGQSLDYKIVMDNVDSSVVRFDLVEYASEQSIIHPAFIESNDVWNCISNGVAGVVCNDDNTFGLVRNATIPVNGTLETVVTKTVSAASVAGQPIDFLAAAFIKNQANEITDVIVIHHQAIVVDNSAPVISWINNPVVAFIEDDSLPQTLSFSVIDGTGANLDPGYLLTAISDTNDKLNFSNVNVVTNSSNNYTVSFDVLPKPNQFTSAGNTDKINIQIEDDFGAFSNPLIRNVTIDPINDAPSFTASCLNFSINPTPVANQTVITCNQLNPAVGGVIRSTTNWSVSDFITNISAGGVGNETESNQSVIFEIVPVSGIITQGSAIITADPGTFIVNDLLLTLQDGVYGDGRFRVRAIDNGTPAGEVDQCPATSAADHCGVSPLSQEIVFDLLQPVYFVSGVIDDIPLGDEIGIRLYVDGTNTPLGATTLIAGVGFNGNEEIKFTYPQALNDGVAYEVRINLNPAQRNCSIISGETGVIAGANIGDVVIDCDPL